MTVRISGIVLVLVGTLGVAARGGVQITHSIAELLVQAVENSSAVPCHDQVRVETLGSTELACVRGNSTTRAETILSLSMLSNTDNRHISMRLLNDSQVSGYIPNVTRTLFAGGVGWANLGFVVTDEPMEVTVTIVEIGTDGGASSFTEMRASWSLGTANGGVTSHTGQTTQSGSLTGTLQPGQSGFVFLEFEDAGAYVFEDAGGIERNPNTFAHVELRLDFKPAVCSGPNAASTTAAELIRWDNPAGGSYSVAGNWDPDRVPTGDCGDGDTAIFDLNTGSTIAINAADATAGKWRFLNGAYNVTGPADVLSTSAVEPSLEIAGANLTLSGSTPVSADLASVETTIGQGTSHSVMEVNTSGAVWENAGLIKVGNGELITHAGVEVYTDQLVIGTVAGATGTVRVRGVPGEAEPTVDVAGILSIGQVGSGEMVILDGAVVVADEVNIGDPGEGAVTVRGSSNPGDPLNPDDFAFLSARNSLFIGGEGLQPLAVENGGIVEGKFVVIDAAPLEHGRVTVDGQGGLAILNVLDTLTIGASEQVEVEAKDGGLIQAQLLIIGSSQARLGAADLTIRGNASQSDPDRQSKLRVYDRTSTIGPAGLTLVGAGAPGQLNILEGGQASLEGGLQVGGNARGVVVVSMPLTGPPATIGSTLSVTGDTQIGFISAGFVTVELGTMHNFGGLRIGNSDLAQQSNLSTSLANVDVQGALEIGNRGPGAMTLEGSEITCESLLVGGSVPKGSGVMTVTALSTLTISGNAQVGVDAGNGLIEIDSTSNLSVNGTMTVGGPGGGTVVVNGSIIGTGQVVAVPNGRVEGTGRITATKVSAGGFISPGLSPGTLTIEGDYELLGTGVQIIEYAGLNPGEFDRLVVTGTATLGGRLEVHFRAGFSPADPDAFVHAQDFIEPDQGVIGDYDERVFVYPDLFADFDNDGDKDLSDAATFQNCFGLSGKAFLPECVRADWEGDGAIGEREVRELSARFDGPQ